MVTTRSTSSAVEPKAVEPLFGTLGKENDVPLSNQIPDTSEENTHTEGEPLASSLSGDHEHGGKKSVEFQKNIAHWHYPFRKMFP